MSRLTERLHSTRSAAVEWVEGFKNADRDSREDDEPRGFRQRLLQITLASVFSAVPGGGWGIRHRSFWRLKMNPF